MHRGQTNRNRRLKLVDFLDVLQQDETDVGWAIDEYKRRRTSQQP
jgi:hypothetical protein